MQAGTHLHAYTGLVSGYMACTLNTVLGPVVYTVPTPQLSALYNCTQPQNCFKYSLGCYISIEFSG